MGQRARWQVLLWSALIWAVLGPFLASLLLSLGMVFSGRNGRAPGSPFMLLVWLFFAPGAAVCGASCGALMHWYRQHLPNVAALYRRGLAWGAVFGLLAFLLGFACLVLLTWGEGSEGSWLELGWALVAGPTQSREILFAYSVIALSGAILGWVVAKWIVIVRHS